jgi:SAM-dependent methyltransferase
MQEKLPIQSSRRSIARETSASVSASALTPALRRETRPGLPAPYWIGALWTARQRQMHPVHYAISYRASFKPELPDFFIRRYLLERGVQSGVVLDPFGGRGTTALQANLLGFRAIHNDLNPVSLFLARSRSRIAPLERLVARTDALDLSGPAPAISAAERKRLSPFFHTRTLKEILNLRAALQAAPDDAELAYIGLTALSRLHGHSDGFFSVYSFPQISIMPEAQARNNLARNQKPEYRSVKERIIRKLRQDLATPLPAEFAPAAARNRFINCDARRLAGVKTGSVDLAITSPPFLDKVNYLADNWMRAWFLGLDVNAETSPLTMTPDVGEWRRFMRDVMAELGRVLKPGARAVIEVGEVAVGGKNRNLEELLLADLPLATKGGRIIPEEVFINEQRFTKLANCWDVSNNQKGTNTNRCLVFRKVAESG